MKEAGNIKTTYLWQVLLSIVFTGSCCFLLLLLTGLIPRSAIKESCIESAEYFREYGMFPCLIEGQLNTKKDNYSDCILVDIMYHISQDELVKSTIKASYYQPETTTINIGFMDSLKEDKVPNVEYSRYWHGTLTFLRPLFTFTDIQGARAVLSTVWIALTIGNLLLLWKEKAKALAVCYLLSNIWLQAWVCTTCIQYSTMFFVMNGVSIATVFLFRRRKDTESLYRKIGILMAVSGVFTCFIDFLTTETLTVTIPLLMLLVLRYEAGELSEWKTEFRRIASWGLTWGAGYALMFVFKWILVAICFGRESFRLALSSAGVRFLGETYMGGTSLTPIATPLQMFFGAIFRNQGMLFPYKDNMSALAGFFSFFAVIFVCGSLVYLFRGKNFSGKMLLLCAVLGAVPYIRFMVLQNHAFIHYFFTYRAQMVTVTALLYVTWKFGLGNVFGKKKR